MKHWMTCLPALALLLAGDAAATTWVETEVDDPIDPSAQCAVHEPASYGSYIYLWPSKYDQVFWPYTDTHGIWHCKGSGYTAFMGDFADVGEDEKTAIAAYLRDRHDGGHEIEDKLALLEGIYALRQSDERSRTHRLRVLARWYQDLGEIDRANGYRKQAFARIQQELDSDIPEDQKLEYLYVAANYARLFGDIEASGRYIERLTAAAENPEDPKLADYAEYLVELVGETPNIESGGVLDPRRAEEEEGDDEDEE